LAAFVQENAQSVLSGGAYERAILEVKAMDDTTFSDNITKSLPPLSVVRGLMYDEICVHLCFSIIINQESYPSVVWSWYVLAGDKEPDGDWKFWGLVSKNQSDFEEFRLGKLRGIAESWNSKLLLEDDLEFTPLSKVMEKLGLRWYNNDW